MGATMKPTLKRTRYIELNSIREVDREHVARYNPYNAFISETNESSPEPFIEDDIKTTFMLSLCVRVYHSNLRREDSVRNEAIKEINGFLYGSFKEDLISLTRLIQEDKHKAIKLLDEMIRQLP